MFYRNFLQFNYHYYYIIIIVEQPNNSTNSLILNYLVLIP